jgi:signal transduction histidine kinase
LRTLELEHVAKTGEIRCYDVTCVVRRDQHGRPTSVLGVSRDITERLRAQQAVQKDRAFLRQLVDVHERERSVFAYEIHDGIMPRITASIMHLESSCAGHFLGAPERGEFEQGLSLLEVAISEGRRLISGLRPPILDEAGVVAAIEYLVSEYRPRIPGLTFTYTAQFDRLAPPLENAVFRVVQEALNNVSRHSFSQVASVELSATDDGLRIVVSDRGIGFDPLQVDERRFGLQGIRERARLLAGQAWIESAPGAGTVVRVDFPLLLAAATTGE